MTTLLNIKDKLRRLTFKEQTGLGEGYEALLVDASVDRFTNLKPIGWYGAMSQGMQLAEGAEWNLCPDCGEDCVWVSGNPTAIHRGGVDDTR